VTGANGFIAGHIILDLLKAGYIVRGTIRSLQDTKMDHFINHIPPQQRDHFHLFALPNLNQDIGFTEAFAGAEYIIHCAAPFTFTSKDPENEVINPCMNGIRFSINAAVRGGAKRYILISSLATLCGTQRSKNPNHIFTPDDWNDEMAIPYTRGKTLSEKLFWEIAKETPQIEFVSLNPSVVLGSIFDASKLTSVNFVYNIVNGSAVKDGVSAFTFGAIDVKDVSESTVKSLTNNKVVGKRVILCHRGNYSGLMIAKLVEDNFPGEFVLPDKVKNNQTVNIIEHGYDNSLAIELLGRDLIPMSQTVRDTVNTLKEKGLVHPTKKN